jgi:hypothetical protein
MLLLFSGVPSLELPEVKTTVGSARSRTVGAALFPAVAYAIFVPRRKENS